MGLANIFHSSTITILIIMNHNSKINLFFFLVNEHVFLRHKGNIHSWLKPFSTRVMAFKRRQPIDHFQSCAMEKKKKKRKQRNGALGTCFACVS